MLSTKKNIDEIDFSSIDATNIYRYFLSKNKPILITNIFDHFPLLSSWSMDHLNERLGDREVKVNTSSTGTFALNPKTGRSFSEPLYLSFRNYIDLLNSNNHTHKLYMQQLKLGDDYRALTDEIGFNKYIPQDFIKAINLWVGPGGNTSPLHFDRLNNFFIQLYGTKKIWLYDPLQFFNLYPNSCFSKAPHISKVDAEKVDVIRYPKAQKTECIEITVPPGTILFIPAYWWHQVLSASTSISVNIWCRTTLRQKLVPGYFHDGIGSMLTAFRSFVSHKSETRNLP